MPLAKLAIKQPVFITMVLIAVTLVGLLSYFRMGVDLYPEMSQPVVSVSVPFPGASPQDVETLISKPLEKSLATINGVDTISSTSREGSAQVMVTFVAGFDIHVGAQEVREQLDSFTRLLPTGAQDPILRRFDPSSSPFLTVALNIQAANYTPEDTRRMVEDIITPRLQSLQGVAAVNVSGLSVQQINVNLVAAKLKALRVSPLQVVTALQNQNTLMPSGRVNNSNVDMPVRTTAQFQTMDEVSNIVVATRGTQNIKVGDIATVNPELPDKQTLVRVNGQNTLMISLQKQSGSNVVQTAALTRDQLTSLNRDFPVLNFTIINDDSTFISQSDQDVTITLIIGAFLAFIIVLLFIRNLRNTLITVAGLPAIVLASFAVISFLGYTRNIVTLMALSLSIGLLIDDAIVVRENIFRHMENGESPKEAAEKGTTEIAFAVLAISLTIVAVFIPVSFTSGQIGRLLNQFGITVSIAVLISLFEAFTFAPLLSAYFAKPLKKARETVKESARESKRGIVSRVSGLWESTNEGYKNILAWSLRHRVIILGSTAVMFLATLWLMTTLPLSFFPATDSGRINIGIQLSPGAALPQTDAIAQDVEQTVMAQPEVTRVYSNIGSSSAPYSGGISVVLKDGTNSDAFIAKLRGIFTKYGRTVSFSKPNQFLGVGGGMGPGGGTQIRGRPVVVSIQGPVNLDTLDGVADQVIKEMSAIPGLRDVDKSLPPQEPELEVFVDRQRTANAGISASTVGNTIRTLIQGTTATQMDWQDRLTDVVVQLRPEDGGDPSTLGDLPVATTTGDMYPLSAVAQIRTGTGPTTLSRQNQQEQILVGANLEGRTQGEVIPFVQKALSGMQMPAGVTWQFSGQQANTQTAFSSLIFAMILGLVFVYMVLASQFGSFIHPFTVMIALPLAIIGAAIAMYAAHVELTVISMIGVILMMGLATKNSILLVDFIIRYRKQGRERDEAVLAAGPVRLRPILMTTMAIIIGMVPTAIGFGGSGAFRAPMAIAVIGGQFSATLLSLIVIPVVYTVVDDWMVALSHLFHRHPTVKVPAVAAEPDVVEELNIEGNRAPNGGSKSKKPAENLDTDKAN
jgi:hydrophobic/amphiphilic exporter-1 (mainly G- bacteria), HAE1 family